MEEVPLLFVYIGASAPRQAQRNIRICRHQLLYSILRVLAAYVKQLPRFSSFKIEGEGAGEMAQIECVLYVAVRICI